MKLRDFRTDARRKKLRDREVFDFIGMGWQVVPQNAKNRHRQRQREFPPRHAAGGGRALIQGAVTYDRKEIRHPEKNVLQK
jgi:hypothetical protein